MGIARICGQFWSHPKRLRLERLTAGKWAKTPAGGAICGAEAVGRILAWLDSLNDSKGHIPDVQDMADVAGWVHEPADLLSALVESRLVEQDSSGAHYWHDFAALNGSAIRQRNYRRNASHNGPHNGPHNEKRGSGSGSGSCSSSGSGSVSPSSKESDFADEIALWNGIAKQRGLPTVRKLSDRERSSLNTMIAESDGADHLEQAFRLAASEYARVDGRHYGLKSLIRACNRGKWLDAARSGAYSGSSLNDWEPPEDRVEKLVRETPGIRTSEIAEKLEMDLTMASDVVRMLREQGRLGKHDEA